jgi:hypothetical protein
MLRTRKHAPSPTAPPSVPRSRDCAVRMAALPRPASLRAPCRSVLSFPFDNSPSSVSSRRPVSWGQTPAAGHAPAPSPASRRVRFPEEAASPPPPGWVWCRESGRAPMAASRPGWGPSPEVPACLVDLQSARAGPFSRQRPDGPRRRGEKAPVNARHGYQAPCPRIRHTRPRPTAAPRREPKEREGRRNGRSRAPAPAMSGDGRNEATQPRGGRILRQWPKFCSAGPTYQEEIKLDTRSFSIHGSVPVHSFETTNWAYAARCVFMVCSCLMATGGL